MSVHIRTCDLQGKPRMLDDFFVRALLAAASVGCVAGPLGCFLLWRRMAYFGDTMAHSALLGIALGMVLGSSPVLGVFAIVFVTALSLLFLQRTVQLASDTLLGLLSHTALALGVVVIAISGSANGHSLLGYLFGDVLAVTRTDLAMVWIGGFICLTVLAYIWRPLVALTVHEDLARAEGSPVERSQIIYMILMAAAVAAGMKVVGVLLVVAMLIIPAAAAQSLSRTPEQMAVLAAIIGIISGSGGLYGSLVLDTPSGPSIVVMAGILFLVSLLVQPISRALESA